MRLWLRLLLAALVLAVPTARAADRTAPDAARPESRDVGHQVGDGSAQVHLRDPQVDPPAERFGQVVVSVDEGRPAQDLSRLIHAYVRVRHRADPSSRPPTG